MELTVLAGDTVRLSLQLHEPHVVVVPFVFAAVKDISGGLRLEACSSRSVEEEAMLEAVLDALIGRGAPLDRLAAQGYGEEHPVASNETEAGRARNRRIVFTALD